MSFFIPLSSPIFWNSNHLAAISLKDLHIFFYPSYKIHLYIYNNTTRILQHTIIHCPPFPHSIILKLHHFCYSKHISISFFISHTKSPFLESNIINVMTQKTTPAAALATVPYIFHTHTPQNTHTYLSYIFKFYVSQSVYVYIYIYIYKIHV